MCFSHSRKGFYLSVQSKLQISGSSFTDISIRIQAQAWARFFRRASYEAIICRRNCRWGLIDWLAFTRHTFGSENCTWDSTPFMRSWKCYFVTRTLLKVPAWTSGGEEGLMNMSGAAHTALLQNSVGAAVQPLSYSFWGQNRVNNSIWTQTQTWMV